MLEELKAALAAATPGEWEDAFFPGVYSEGVISCGDRRIADVCGKNQGEWRDDADEGDVEFAANAHLIVTLKNAAPALIEAVEALQQIVHTKPIDYDYQCGQHLDDVMAIARRALAQLET